MTYFKKISTVFFLLIFTHVSSFGQEHFTHSIWNELTAKHVSAKGNVNYKGFIKDEKKLNTYLTELSKHHPEPEWDNNDQLAFWINAYNAFTVKLIIKNYPLKSIKDIGGSIYKVNTAWDIKFIHIGDETYDLNNIEHGIIRKDFDEPRIHFALNCASVSCPRLRNEAFVGSMLDEQLDDQAEKFINNPDKNTINSNNAELSKIFQWFKGDFNNGNSNVISFINRYSDKKITKKTKISYKSYDWNLNE